MLSNGRSNDLVYYMLELTSNNIRIAGYQKILNAYNMAMDLQEKLRTPSMNSSVTGIRHLSP
ncbi:MAG: hypothetical protein ACLUE2_19970 [Bacteroides cellulosilyticus]